MNVKIKPGFFSCKSCMDMANTCKATPPCNECPLEKTGTLVSTHAGLLHLTAIVRVGKDLISCSLSQVEVVDD